MATWWPSPCVLSKRYASLCSTISVETHTRQAFKTGINKVGKPFSLLALTLDDDTAVLRGLAWDRDATVMAKLLEKGTYYEMHNCKYNTGKEGYANELWMTSATIVIRCEDQEGFVKVNLLLHFVRCAIRCTYAAIASPYASCSKQPRPRCHL